jgi:hypothetical protein
MEKTYIVKDDEEPELIGWLLDKDIDFEWEIIHPNLDFMRRIARNLPTLRLRKIAFDIIDKINDFIMKGNVIFIIKIGKRREVGENEL